VEQKFPFTLQNYNSSRNIKINITKEEESFDIRIFDEIQQFKEIWRELTSKQKSNTVADQVSALKVHDIIEQLLYPLQERRHH
jgi:predicted transcriptional regulator